MTNTTKLLKGLAGGLGSIVTLATFLSGLWENTLSGDLTSGMIVFALVLFGSSLVIAVVRDWSDGPGLTSREAKALFLNLLLGFALLFGVFLVAQQVPSYVPETLSTSDLLYVSYYNGTGYDGVNFTVSETNVSTLGSEILTGYLHGVVIRFADNLTLGDLKSLGIVGFRLTLPIEVGVVDFKKGVSPYDIFRTYGLNKTSFDITYTVADLSLWYGAYGDCVFQLFVKFSNYTIDVTSGITFELQYLKSNNFKYWDWGFALAIFVGLTWISLRLLEFDDDVLRYTKRFFRPRRHYRYYRRY